MALRFTEEEAFKQGFRKDEKGNWYQAKQRDPNRNPTTQRIIRKLGEGFRDGGSGKVSDSQRNDRQEEPLSHSKVHEDRGTGGHRFRIVVTVFAQRHQDPDNIYPKHFIDLIVRAGILPDDSSKYVEGVEKKIIKVESVTQEKTVIEVFRKCSNKR